MRETERGNKKRFIHDGPTSSACLWERTPWPRAFRRASLARIALSCTYLILYIISVAIVAQAIVLQAVSWGNHVAQESTVDGAVLLNSDAVTWAF